MKKAAIAELKAHLSKYLKEIKAGEEILITDRGIPVAKLVPLGRKERQTSRRYRLAKAGLLRLGRGRARKALLSTPRGTLAGKTVLQALIEQRREDR